MDVIKEVKLHKNLTAQEISSFHPVKLAYIGDAIYELYIRKFVLTKHNLRIKDINQKCISYVKATAQSYVVALIMPLLTEEEQKVFKRGRNSSSNTMPKNTSMIDYKMATGFEALLGFHYLNDNVDRLEELIAESIRIIEDQEK